MKVNSVAPKILSGFRKATVVSRIWTSTFFFILKYFPNPKDSIQLIRQMNALKNKFTLDKPLKKLVKVDGRYFFNLNNTGWPSPHFNRLIELEGRNMKNEKISLLENIRMVLIAITKKCPLFCEHCYESEELNKKDTLTLNEHKKILKKFQNAGISQFQFGGGEPMAKVHDLIELLKSSSRPADFWISTSGFNFTEENSIKLKEAGLTGVSISIDHFDSGMHNIFRGNKEAYTWAIDAAKNAVQEKLVVAFTICVTKPFCTEENLMHYVNFAYNNGASFVQLLEPRSVGNYAGKDVSLHPEHEKILESFYMRMNNDSKFKHLPVVIYHGLRQRMIGCAGAGSRYLYVDTDGYMNSCPFCRNKSRHVLDEETESAIRILKEEGCAKFATLA